MGNQLDSNGGFGRDRGDSPSQTNAFQYLYDSYALSTGLRMIPLKSHQFTLQRVESWIRLFPCFNSCNLRRCQLFTRWGWPPIYPLKDSRNMWRFFYLKLWQAAGLGSMLDPWPYRLITLTTCCWVREKRNLTPQEMEGLGSWSSLCPLEHRFPKLPTIGWSWPSIVGRSSYQNSRWHWLQLRPFCFSLFEDWNCRNMTV